MPKNPLRNIFAFRVFDFRDRFPDPVPTFLAALEKLQCGSAYMPEQSEIVAYLLDGRTITIPTHFFIREEMRFASRTDAEKWVRERAAKITENPKKRIFGALIADADDPIEKQIEDAARYTFSKVIDANENETTSEAVENWLRDAIRSLPEIKPSRNPKNRKFVQRFSKRPGTLIKCLDGSLAFREYHADGSFTDFEILHSDLSINIDDDDAAIYEIDGHYIIDHAPETLGIVVNKSEK